MGFGNKKLKWLLLQSTFISFHNKTLHLRCSSRIKYFNGEQTLTEHSQQTLSTSLQTSIHFLESQPTVWQLDHLAAENSWLLFNLLASPVVSKSSNICTFLFSDLFRTGLFYLAKLITITSHSISYCKIGYSEEKWILKKNLIGEYFSDTFNNIFATRQIFFNFLMLIKKIIFPSKRTCCKLVA